jgi:anti-sigma regulatory factor (Ser/Thr protein kinase)
VTANFAADQIAVRDYVIGTVLESRPNIANGLQERFGVSRATAHNYLSALLAEGLIVRTAPGRYELGSAKLEFSHPVQGLEEHRVWANEIRPALAGLSANLIDIWHYGCTEMINNVIDHSESSTVMVAVNRTAVSTDIAVRDAGVGSFRKIARALNLEDDRHAALELSKGKVTTDPANHSGEGIFFSSRAFDDFTILSGGVYFRHQLSDDQDWILGDGRPLEEVTGTTVIMELSNSAQREIRKVFDEYATDTEEYRFDRTVVPVRMLQYGDEHLISRSQAKRLLSRFDRFRTVVLNFENVDSIGQAFADEVFRVFPTRHPEIELLAIHANEQVTRMMNRAKSEERR